MVTYSEFKRELRDALANLYDPGYRPSEMFCAIIGCDSRGGAIAVQSAIIQAIKSLEPLPDVPVAAHTRRVYDLLYSRYVLRLTQEVTADRLGVSRRTAQRAQPEAVHVLARTLWERGGAGEWLESADGNGAVSDVQPLGKSSPDSQVPDWRAQAEREVTALQESAPAAMCDVGEVIDGVMELESALTSQRDVHVEVGFVQPNLVADVHPIVLRQVLVTVIERLARCTSSGQIPVFARLEDGNVKIAIATAVTPESELTGEDLVGYILPAANVLVSTHVDSGRVFVWITIPAGDTITVLVVDDNLDIVHFYRRAMEGTRYRIVHATHGQGLFDTIEASAPAIIVLDVMLPDVDGWKLLTHLHENPNTRSIPVIVCSVVRAEELALSLGAVLYLPKPVRPSQFKQALDRVLPAGLAKVSIPPANSAATC
jgi:CheY-like chemotaxis protein